MVDLKDLAIESEITLSLIEDVLKATKKYNWLIVISYADAEKETTYSNIMSSTIDGAKAQKAILNDIGGRLLEQFKMEEEDVEAILRTISEGYFAIQHLQKRNGVGK